MSINNTFEAIHDTPIPAEMARLAEHTGMEKAKSGILKTTVLSILAGAYIAFGALFATLVTSGSTLPFGLMKLMGGLAFCLGLILVVCGGAELFTGNILMVMAWAGRKATTKQLLRNWLIVYLGNMAGAFSIVVMVILARHYLSGEGVVGANIIKIAEAKCQLGFVQAIFLGILCNILVCLAIWLCYGAKTVQGKILAIIFPITAFVAAGFEHSIANMYFIPLGILVRDIMDPGNFQALNWTNYFLTNLLPVSIGNIIGGSVFVGLAYRLIYLSKLSNNSDNTNYE